MPTKRHENTSDNHAPKRAATYRRVSTIGQAKEGLSLDDQQLRIAAFAEREGIKVVADYADCGRSGRKGYTETRPDFQRLLADARAGKFDAVIVFELRRWSRNLFDYHTVQKLLDALGVKLIEVSDPSFDQTNAAHRLKRNIEIAVGEYQADDGRTRSIEVRLTKLELGRFNLGQRLPLGLQWADKEGTKLERHPYWVQVWNLIKALRLKGYGCGRIADTLNGKAELDESIAKAFPDLSFPVKNRWGKKRWREGAIAGMTRDKDDCRVCGELSINFKTTDGDVRVFKVPFEPLMTRGEHHKFLKLSQTNLTWEPRNTGKGSVLSGLMRCGLCGAKLHVTGSKGQKWYGCANRLHPDDKRQRCALPLLRADRAEMVALKHICSFLRDDKVFERALEAAGVGVRDKKAAIAKLTRQAKLLVQEETENDRKLQRLVQAIADGGISGDDARRVRAHIETDQEDCERRRAAIETKQGLAEHSEDTITAIDRARKSLRKYYRQLPELLALGDQEKQDLLRTLLPPQDGFGILVSPAEPGKGSPGCSWQMEIRGVLPLDGGDSFKLAVLGGALAVP